MAVRCGSGLVFGNWVCLADRFGGFGWVGFLGDGRWRVTGGGGDGVVAGGGNWVRLVHLFGEIRCVGLLGGEAVAVAGAGKAADLKTEIRATGLRRSWAYKLLI